MKQPIKRLTALLLTAVWVLGAALPALAEETGTANGEIISIATTADLLALQNRCIVDTATQNLTVQLQADLDLSGCAFTGLPVFSGHFDGQGHTISGLALADGSSVQGFFRYLEATAVVEDLHLQGSVGGSDATVQSLLAGENRGLVRGCSASGQAEAAQEAGGLVGRNESSGQIVNCRSTATVQADRMAGGVAGQNLGSIVRCRNDGDINTALTGASGSLLGVSLSGEDGASLTSVSDIGGIAGRSSGILQSCENTGAIGYASVGSNVGGIVGRTSGYLDGCTNSGTVQGSQEVGGVAGQLEPVLALQYDGGRLDDLYSELDALQGEMDTLLTHTDTGGDSISAALSALTGATRTAKDSTGALADGMVSWADNGIAAVNSTASRFSWAIDQLGPVLDSVGTALAQANAAGAALEQLLQDASLAAGWSEDAKAQWQTAVEAFAAARSRARDALEQAYAALQALQAALGDDEASSAAWARLAEALNTLQTAAGQVQDAADTLEGLLNNLGSATEPADRPQELKKLYQALLSCQQARNTMEVGGVAGYGGEITNCRTMVELLPGEDTQAIRYAGTIAGRAASDAALADNQYVHESLGAVDGVTRAAQALPANFESLAADPDAPDGFARLELTFTADGKTVATVTFRYGEGVTSLPAVPQKDGYVGQWPDLDYTHLTYSQTVEAEYIPYASALADDSGETPQVLVDGSFSPQAKVTVTTAETSFSDADGRTHSGLAYTITVTDPVFGAPDCTVHFRKPNTTARYTLWIQQDDTWIEQRPQVDGSYLLIQCPGGQITFVAEETTANVWLVFLIAAGVLLAAAVFVILWRRHTRKPHHTPPKAEN